MTKRWIYLGVTALAVFLGALLLRTPAPWVLAGANRLLPLEISWNEARGTIAGMDVRGLGFTLPGGRRVWFSRVTLEPALLPLFGGQLRLYFRVDDAGEQLAGAADFGLKRWELVEIDGKLPLTALLPTLPELEIAGLEGRVSIEGEAVAAEYGSLPTAGRLLVGFEAIRVTWLRTDQPLGSYRMALQAQEQAGLSGAITTLTNPALFSLSATVVQEPASQTLKFQGAGQISPDAPASLRRILPILGKAGRDRVAIGWQFTLD